MWFYYRLLQINYVPFQQIFSTIRTEAHPKDALQSVVWPLKISFLTNRPLLLLHTVTFMLQPDLQCVKIAVLLAFLY